MKHTHLDKEGHSKCDCKHYHHGDSPRGRGANELGKKQEKLFSNVCTVNTGGYLCNRTQSFRLKKPLKTIEPNHKPGTAKSTMSLSATTKLLNTSRDDGSTTCLSSLFQSVTLSVKTFFLLFSLNFPWHNLRPYPLYHLLHGRKKVTPTLLQPPVR